MPRKSRKSRWIDQVTDPQISSDAVYRASMESARQEMLNRHARLSEEERFYNAPRAQADFDQWIDRLWTLDEATALSLGKNPKVVNSASIAHLAEVWDFSREYIRRAEFFVRSGFDKTAAWPGRRIVTWAAEVGVIFPEQLRSVVDQPSPALPDVEVSGRNQLNDLQVGYTDALARIAELEKLLREREDENPKSKRTSDRLVYALALKFKFEPSTRSSAVTHIHSLLEAGGVQMDRGVILDRLQAALTRRAEGDL